MINVDKIKMVIAKLPHSATRVPYTYHHDYLRQYSPFHNGMSRSEVSQSSSKDELELYAMSLAKLISDLGSDFIVDIDAEYLQICKDAIMVAKESIKRYNA